MSIKHNKGKPDAGMLLDFSLALESVSKAATFGSGKYSRYNWETVDKDKYMHAFMRHTLQIRADADRTMISNEDAESGLPHIVHAAWNLLAVVELELRKLKLTSTTHTTQQAKFVEDARALLEKRI